ncbi:hypothetical protein Btru_054149 [Bulinus truncatus]|nr:hypothetical protein Btru_054149 [Bulinus truncatus]
MNMNEDNKPFKETTTDVHRERMSTSVYVVITTLLLTYNVTLSDVPAPLHLTPYIHQHNITAAKDLSLVLYSNITSYAGFITVDQLLGNHLFFWFFPAFSSDPAAPLVVWLNGGPGVPSMLGLFHENGPLRLQVKENGAMALERWNQSWAENFSMLYIDNPVGVGYSYTESGERGYRTSQDGYSKDLQEFIEQFYVMFPEYLQRQLYIGGQSYAGKFVTSFAYRLHRRLVTGQSKIPLTGIYLGAPFLDPYSQSRAMAGYFYSSGAISQRQLRDHKRLVDRVFAGLRAQNLTSDEAVGQLLMDNYIVALWADNYNTRSSAPNDQLWYLMNIPEMKALVHAGNVTFAFGDDEFKARYNQDRTQSVKNELSVLLNSYKVLIYNGDIDAVVTSDMVEAALTTVWWSSRADYLESSREVWSDGHTLKGFYTRTGRFCRVVIHGAGHQAPYDQPEVSLDMMNQFINSGCINASSSF